MAETYNSQDFADYFNEYRYVDDKEKSDDSLDDEYKSEDCEGQLEWFQKVGLNSEHLSCEDGKEAEENHLNDFMMSLTHRQATIVRKKVATYKATVRKRKASKSRIRDVREVFSQTTTTTTTATTTESISSSETRSRSETPDSLGSLSPCDSTPSSPDWDPQPGNASVASSQGYHSHPRNSPNSPTPSFSLNSSVNPTKTNKTSNNNIGSSNGYSSSDQEWDKVRRPPDGSANNNPYNNYDHHTKLPPSATREYPFFKTTRNKFDQIPKNHDPAAGIENRKFRNIGSWYGGARGLDISLPSHLEVSENDIAIDVRDDGDQEWDFDYSGSDVSDEDLPSFHIVLEKMGTTYITDLSNEDVFKIQSLACLEFAIIADMYRIQYYRRKGRKKRRKDENSIFGVPLATLIQRDRKLSPNCKIPLVLETILNYLERTGFREEGILRVPGSTHKKDLLKMELEHNFYTNPPSVEKAFQMCSTNDIIAILKYFIRELPNPLFTNDCIEAFFQLDSISDSMDLLKAMKLLILQLPEVHRNTLWALLTFLSKIADNEKFNRMSLQNVAMIMAPNLFLAKTISRNDAKRDLSTEMDLAAATCRLTKLMIKYRDIMFTVPGFMLKQIRVQHENAMLRKNAKENNKPKKFFSTKKPAKADIYRKINNEVDFQNGIIRIQAPQFNVLNLPIELKNSTTAGEIVQHIIKSIGHKTTPPEERRHRVQGRLETRRAFSELIPNGTNICLMSMSDLESVVKAHYLYEVGGNIGERRLHQDTSVIAVYQENPNAEWVIRCHHHQQEFLLKGTS